MLHQPRKLRRITPEVRDVLLNDPLKKNEITRMSDLEKKNAQNPGSMIRSEIKELTDYRIRVRENKAADLSPSEEQRLALHPGRNEKDFPKPEAKSVEKKERKKYTRRTDATMTVKQEVPRVVAASVEAKTQKQLAKEQRALSAHRKEIIQKILPDRGRGRYSATERMKIAKAFAEAGYKEEAAQMMPSEAEMKKVLATELFPNRGVGRLRDVERHKVETAVAEWNTTKKSIEAPVEKKSSLSGFTMADVVREFDKTVTIPVVPADDNPETRARANILDVTQKLDLSDEAIPQNTLFGNIRRVSASKCVDLGTSPQ